MMSIIVTTHNRPSLLRRALLSILASNGNFEIVVCADDNSKDTFKVACDLLRPEDSFLRVPTMSGPSASRNLGAVVSKGDWICLLDDDDTFGECHLEKVLEKLDQERECVYYFNYTTVDEIRNSNGIFPEKISQVDISKLCVSDLFVKNFLPIHSMIFPSSVFHKHKFDQNLQSHEDWDFIISLLTSGYSFKWCEGHLDGVMVHRDSSRKSRNWTAVTALDYLSIYRKWPSKDPLTKELRAKKLKKLGISRFGIKINPDIL